MGKESVTHDLSKKTGERGMVKKDNKKEQGEEDRRQDDGMKWRRDLKQLKITRWKERALNKNEWRRTIDQAMGLLCSTKILTFYV
ncbi:hypothetical protein ILUMI_04023 [Ignelater luminosus]|uniref:Uncharacterized protein n=1 Tax=Ignelater luminosus TaxID=2038154 RepID=A0A8K0D9Q7_IGNLU|nr:hypothetical protein ILUMI_04023 [Ignelater luminosus]